MDEESVGAGKKRRSERAGGEGIEGEGEAGAEAGTKQKLEVKKMARQSPRTRSTGRKASQLARALRLLVFATRLAEVAR
jgi:hypothetical protein